MSSRNLPKRGGKTGNEKKAEGYIRRFPCSIPQIFLHPCALMHRLYPRNRKEMLDFFWKSKKTEPLPTCKVKHNFDEPHAMCKKLQGIKQDETGDRIEKKDFLSNDRTAKERLVSATTLLWPESLIVFLFVGDFRLLIISAVAAAQCWSQSLSTCQHTGVAGLLGLVATVVAEAATLRAAHVVSATEAACVLGHLTVSGHVGAGELSGGLLETTRAGALGHVRSVDVEACWLGFTLRRHRGSSAVLGEAVALRSGRETRVGADGSCGSGSGGEALEVGGRRTVLAPLDIMVSQSLFDAD